MIIVIVVGSVTALSTTMMRQRDSSPRSAESYDAEFVGPNGFICRHPTPIRHKIKMLYATKPIEAGSQITQDALEERYVWDNLALVDSFESVNAAVGQVAAYRISPGQIVAASATATRAGVPVAPTKSTYEFASQRAIGIGMDSNLNADSIKEGQRVLTVGIDSNPSVAYYINGRPVDFINITGTDKSAKVASVLSDVPVLALAMTSRKNDFGPASAEAVTSVTVVVSPENAVTLSKAASAGKLWLRISPWK
ncbi:MAG TPA: RcpC/CpaB family pilus assembly protein [Candidatus Obscuribacterales bacterium]